MQSSQLVKKRLYDLKKLSQNLKQSTQVNADVDVGMIKAILQITKNIHKQPIPSSQNSKSNISVPSSPRHHQHQHYEITNNNNNGLFVYNNNNNNINRNHNNGSISPNLPKTKSSSSITSKFISPTNKLSNNNNNSNTNNSNNVLLLQQYHEVHEYQNQNQNQNQHEDEHEHDQQQNIQPLFPQNSNNNNNNSHKNSINSSRLIKNVNNIQYNGNSNSNSNSKTNLGLANNNNNNNDQQLIYLRQQNNRLNIQLNNTKAKLNQYKIQQQLASQQQNNQSINVKDNKRNGNMNNRQQHNDSPYFQLTQPIAIFATKLNIAEEDYHKIQYKRKQLRLTLDKIVIASGKKSSYQTVSSPSLYLSSVTQQFNLADLTSLKYIPNSPSPSIMLQFQSQKQIIYLYLQFDDQQTMHRWDLGLFINYKIVYCLGKDKIFQEEAVFDKDKGRKNSDGDSVDDRSNRKDSAEDGSIDQKRVLQKYLQNKQKYIQSQKKLKQSILSQINQKRNRQKAQKSSQNINQSKQQNPFKDKDKDKHDTNIITIKKQQQAQFILKSPPILSKLSHNSIINNSNQFNNTNNNTYTNISINKEMDQQKNMEQINQQMQKQDQLESKEQLQNKLQAQRKQKIDQAISLVKKGMFMTKYAKSAYKPHQKRVYISEDNTQFCWQDKQNSKQPPKYVLISQIQSINKGELGPGVLKHLDEKKIKNVNCFMLITLNCKDRKTLEFSMKSLKLMEQFVQAFIVFLGQYKQGKLTKSASSMSKLSPNKK